MDISGCTALVTGANRGLGRRFAADLLARGAKVYAGARNPDSVDVDGAIPLAVDVTDPASVTAAAAAAGDVTLLINNAGIAADVNLLTGDLDGARREMETNYFGALSIVRDPQRAVRAVLGELPGPQRVLRVEVGGLVDDERGPR